MALRNTTQIAQPVQGSAILPSRIPNLPPSMVERFPDAAKYNEDINRWYRTVRTQLSSNLDELAYEASDVRKTFDLLRTEVFVTQDQLAAAISIEAAARIEGDNTLLAYINTQISAVSGVGTRLKIQNEPPTDPALNDLWYDLNDGLKRYYWNGSAWVDATESRLTGVIAAVATESTARISGDEANATRITALESTVNTASTGVLARILVIEDTFATEDFVTASISTAITSEITNRDDAIAAAITIEAGTRATDDGALSTRITSLESSVNTPSTGLAARIDVIETTYATDTEVAAAISSAIASATSVGSKVFIQPSAPSGATLNDLWYDSDAGFRPYYWNGSAWADATDSRLPGAIASISAESTTRAGADTALATRTSALEASVNTAGTGLLARVATIESAYVTLSGIEATVETLISASISSSAPGSLGAAIQTESTARANFDGQLDASYVLKATAGNVISQMKLLSTSGPGSTLSAIQFTADAFQIHNGSSGVAVFDLVGGALLLDASIGVRGKVVPATLAGPTSAGLYMGSDYMGYWNGTTWRSYFRNNGNFEMAGDGNNFIAWNGTALNIRGNVEVRSGVLGSSTSVLVVDGDGINIGTLGRIRGGATAPGVGDGVFFGYSGSAYQLYAGSATGDFLRWNGSALTVRGEVRAISGYFGTSTNAVSVTANGLDIGTTGRIRANATSPGTSGIWLGYSGSTYQLYAGNGVNNYIWYDGVAVRIQGTINAFAGYFGNSSNRIAIDSDGLLIGTQGRIAAGTTSPSGTGVFLGYSGSAYQFYVGTTSRALHWDGTELTVQGNLIANTLRASAGFIGSSENVIILHPLGLNIGTSGRIVGGSATAGGGVGVFLGYSGSAHQFYVGNGVSDGSNSLYWNGSNLVIRGSITGSAITGSTLGIGSGANAVFINSSGISVGTAYPCTISDFGSGITAITMGGGGIRMYGGPLASVLQLGQGYVSLNGTGQYTVGGDTTLSRASAGVFSMPGLNVTNAVAASSVQATAMSAGTMLVTSAFAVWRSTGLNAFSASAAGVLVDGVPFYVRNSSGFGVFAVNPSVAELQINGTRVVGTRYGSPVTDLDSAIACLKHHGLCPP